jgi:hypothetical protein
VTHPRASHDACDRLQPSQFSRLALQDFSSSETIDPAAGACEDRRARVNNHREFIAAYLRIIHEL